MAQIFIAENYESMSQKATDDLIKIMSSKQNPLICVASGSSPSGLYKKLVDSENLDISDWNFLGLDEWVGMNGRDEGSCRYHLDRELFHPLNVSENKICFFNGRALDLNSECEKAEKFIQDKGGIDVVILGLGLNGHVGMNEPGTPESIRSHVSTLDQLTISTGQKYFEKPQNLVLGLTLGIANFMEAENVFLVVNGTKKAEIVKQILESDISEKLPGSLLRKHSGLRVYLDNEAAKLL